MCTKRDLKNFLEEISPGAQFFRFDFTSSERFRIDLRSRADLNQTAEFYSEYSKEWIKKFSIFTTTAWNVRSTFTKLKRLAFRKIYICHLSGHNKRKKTTRKSSRTSSRNQDCHATVEFKIKLTNRNTIKNDKLLRDGLNLFIYINFAHSHKVRSPEFAQLLRATSEIEEDFKKLFLGGCMPSAAKCYHELLLISKYGDNRPSIFNNALINPSLHTITYFHAKLCKKTNIDIKTFRELIEERQTDLRGAEVALADTDEITVIITPFMKRIINSFGTDHVFVESVAIRHSVKTTIFFVPAKIGALPIAYLLHGQNTEDFHQTLLLTKIHIERVTNQTFSPKMIVMHKLDDQNQLKDILPETQFMKSRLRMSEEFWRWLNDTENKVERKKRQPLMLSVKSLITAHSTEEAEKIYMELQNNEFVTSNSKLQQQLSILMENRDQWMQKENSSNNLVEISIRFLKECLVQKCKSFTASMMLDIVTNVLETHYKRIIMSFVNQTNIPGTLTLFLNKAKVVLEFGSEVRRIAANEFKLDFASKSTKSICFRTDTMLCSCGHGSKGYICEHLAAIINTIDCAVIKPPELTEEEKNNFTNIVGQDFDDEFKSEYADIKTFNTKEEIVNSDDNFINETMDEDFDEKSSESTADNTTEVNNSIYFDVKTEKSDHYDPLEEENIEEIQINQDRDFEMGNDVMPTSSKCPNKKKRYETALKAVNDEFRRLNRYFCENPNETNYETMCRLARELSKIRPTEQTNLGDLFIKLNKQNKR